MTAKQRVPLAALAAVVTALLMAGCSAAPQVDTASQAGGGAEVAADDSNATAADPAVVVTGEIGITTEDPIAAATRAVAIVTAADGRVDGREESAPEGGRSQATLVLRVPVDAVERVRTGLAELGHVEWSSLQTTNVATTQRDLAARATTLRAALERYDEWLGTAKSTSDLIDLESAISERRAELEGIEAELRALEDQVAMSTITLTLHAPGEAAVSGPRDVGEALAIGWNGFASFWASAGIALAMGLPWLVLLAAIALGVLWLVRRTTRARDAAVAARAQSAASSTLPQPHPGVGAHAPYPATPAAVPEWREAPTPDARES